MPAVAVVLDTLAAPHDPGLDAWLGASRAAALRAALRERALAWAAEAAAAPDPAARASVAAAPRTEAPRVAEASGPGDLLALLDGHDGPVFLVGTDVPRLGAVHLAQARDDLAAGVLLAVAPANDGTPFLLALARPAPELLDLVGAGFEDLVAATSALGGELGLLRLERRVASATDARALAADPAAPADLRALATRPG